MLAFNLNFCPAATGKTGVWVNGRCLYSCVQPWQAPLALPLTEFPRIQWLRPVRVRIRVYINLSQLKIKISIEFFTKKFHKSLGLPGGPVVKNPPCNARDMGLIPGPGRYHMLQGV